MWRNSAGTVFLCWQCPDENVRHAHHWPFRSYRERYSSWSPESASLMTYFSRNLQIKSTYLQPDPRSFQPSHSLGSF